MRSRFRARGACRGGRAGALAGRGAARDTGPDHRAPVLSSVLPGLRAPPPGRAAPHIAQSAFGPRFQAAVATLYTRNRVSRRDVVELCEQLFSSRISTGTADAILARAAEALAEPHADLLATLRGAGAVNMDETGWRTAGERRALWGIFDRRHAYLHLAPDRHEDHAKTLLAETKAIVTSDRWWAYAHLPLARRQLCWAHLRRDFAAHAEGLAAEKEFGEHGLKLCERVFWAWEIYTHTNDRRELKRTIDGLQRDFKPIIAGYSSKRARNKYCRGMARNLLKAWPALWTFAAHPRVEPTNNHAESALYGARSSTASSASAPSPRAANAASSGSSPRTPPAASKAARSSSTSPKRSPPTPAETRFRCSPEHPNPLNAYDFSVFCGSVRLTVDLLGGFS